MKIKLATYIIILINLSAIDSKMTIEQLKNTMKPFKNTCLKKVADVDPVMVEGTKQGNFPDDPTLKCFFKCTLQMLKVLKNGELSVQAMMNQIDIMMSEELVDKTKAIVVDCDGKSKNLEDICERSFAFVKCFYEADSELYFFP
ncbi:hypothetical protein TKK_0001321 [Trichogramma kaykai]|uniref:Uncharacterized protein n=1 Tax=Trichogramma kaykai TaxID=54128 RepID=A0ABD2WRR6_9HYME